jgi:hypothetical protein
MFASDDILKAGLVVLHRGLIEIRNQSCSVEMDRALVNCLAEALHEIPAIVQNAQYFARGEAELLETIRIHLSCFEHAEFGSELNLLELFERELATNYGSRVGA